MLYPELDVECYPNKFMVGLLWKNKHIIYDDLKDIKKIPLSDSKYKFLTFNGRSYDIPLIEAVKKGYNAQELYQLSQGIVNNKIEAKSWNENIIDLYEICPKVARCSLKEIGHRLKYKTLQNLPYPYDKPLTDEEWEEVKKYNLHDLKITRMFWLILKNEYEARQSLKVFFDIKTEYGGVPNLAQKCILSKLGSNDFIDETKKLVKMDNVSLSDELKTLYDETFDHNLSKYLNGRLPKFMKDKININGLNVKIGVGGLHGDSKPGIYRDVYDYDVTSYYPSIILNCELGSDKFRRIYKSIYDQRVKLKKDKSPYANSLKLVLNSLYGKLLDGGCYRKEQIYAPNLGLSVCFLGQFYLLDLIEKLNHNECIIANTDGIICKNKINDDVVAEWENRTGFKLECTKYKHIIVKDCNGYYAETPDGKIKRKKEFLEPSWDHNVKAYVIAKAAINKMLNGVDVSETVMNEQDLYNFCFFAKVTKGKKLYIDEKELDDPKIRYYCSKEGGVLERGSKRSWGVFKIDDFYYLTHYGEGYKTTTKKIKPMFDDNKFIFNYYDENKELKRSYQTTDKLLTFKDKETAIEWVLEFSKKGEVWMKSKIISESKVTLSMNLEKTNEINYDWYIDQANKLIASCVPKESNYE